MAAKFTFRCTSDDRRRPLPHKVLFGLGVNESASHVVLKLLAWLLFFRERLTLETAVPDDNIPFVPDLCQLGYDLRPSLWVECGDCSVAKLHKLAVKCPEAALWIVKRSRADADQLMRSMAREALRRNRYGLVALDPSVVEELIGLLRERNTVHWYRGDFDPPAFQLDFNGLWFDSAFEVLRF